LPVRHGDEISDPYALKDKVTDKQT